MSAEPSAPEGMAPQVGPSVPKRGFFDSFLHREVKKTIPGPKEQGLVEHAQVLRQGSQLIEDHQQNSGSTQNSSLDERTKRLFNAPVVGGAIAGGTKAILNAEAEVSERLANVAKTARHINVGEAAREIAKGERIAKREGHETNLDRPIKGIGGFHPADADYVLNHRFTVEGRMQRLEDRINRDVMLANAMGIEPKYRGTTPEEQQTLEASLTTEEKRQVDLVTAALARNVATSLVGNHRIAEHWGFVRGKWGVQLNEQIRPTINVSRNPDNTLRIQAETHQGTADQIRTGSDTGDISVFRDKDGNPTNPPVGTVARMDVATFEYDEKLNTLYVVQKGPNETLHKTKLTPKDEIDERTVGILRKRKVRDENMQHRRAEQRTVANVINAINTESTHITAVRLGGDDFGSPRTGIFVEHGTVQVPVDNKEVRGFAARITRDRLHMGHLPGDFIMDTTGGEFKSASANKALEEAGIGIVGFDKDKQRNAERLFPEEERNQVAEMLDIVQTTTRGEGETLSEFRTELRKNLGEYLDPDIPAQKGLMEYLVSEGVKNTELTQDDEIAIVSEAIVKLKNLPEGQRNRSDQIKFMEANVTDPRERELWMQVVEPSLESQLSNIQPLATAVTTVTGAARTLASTQPTNNSA